MGWERQQYEFNRMMGIPNNPPCANCGKINGGFMGSTRWKHNYKCCSDRCGMRLKKRIDNGMFPLRDPLNWQDEKYIPDPRLEALRNRIKHLEAQLKKAGIKPKG